MKALETGENELSGALISLIRLLYDFVYKVSF